MADKPEPQRVGVTGFRAFGGMGAAPVPQPVSGQEANGPVIDWEALARLPPFQSFIWKRCPGSGDADWHKWALARIPLEIAQAGSEQTFFDEYCRWHAASGKWPRETPLGKLKE